MMGVSTVPGLSVLTRMPRPFSSFAQVFVNERTAALVDEGEDTTAVGREAIHAWTADYTSKYTTTVKVIDVIEKEGEVVVTVLVSGDFPGNRAEFVYRCILLDDLIARLIVEFVGFN